MTDSLTEIKPFPALDANTVSCILNHFEDELIFINNLIKTLGTANSPILIAALHKELAAKTELLLCSVQDLLFDIDVAADKYKENQK